jgi:ribosomal protein L11 methyltransferase
MKNHIKISIEAVTEHDQEMLVALLSEEGYEGFEETPSSLFAYVSEDLYDEEKLKTILQPFSKLYQKEVIAPKNWNEEWEKNYEPVVVDDFVAVRAHFHQPITTVQHEIVVTPKMSFGTGHHATTWQMMKLMKAVDFNTKSVFDFGCGTGVLAILAEKLGAANILAADYDDWCIENAMENIQNNHCRHIRVVKADAPPAGEHFQIILANINRYILLQHMHAMSNVLAPGGYLFASGFYTDENKLLIDAAAACGLQLKESSERHNWSSLIFQKHSA